MDCLLLHVVFYKLHAGVLIFQVVGQDIILVIEGLSAIQKQQACARLLQPCQHSCNKVVDMLVATKSQPCHNVASTAYMKL